MKFVSPTIKFVLRVSTALVLCILIVRSLDLSALAAQAQRVDIGWYGLCSTLPIIGVLLSAWRWQIVLALLGVRRSYAELLLRYWSGTFYNSILPGSVGGDVVRIGGLTRSGVSLSTSVQSVLTDRIIGLWAGMLLGFASSLWPSASPFRAILGLVFGAIVFGGVATVVVASTCQRYVPTWLQHYVNFTVQLGKRDGWSLVGLSLAFQLLVVLTLYTVVRAVNAPVSLLACGIYAQAAVLTTLLPISLNGIGVREITFIALLSGVGVAPETAALIGVLVYVASVIGSLPGALATILLPSLAADKAAPTVR